MKLALTALAALCCAALCVCCDAANVPATAAETSAITGGEVSVIPREAWGASAASCSTPDPDKWRITLHHTAEATGGDDFATMLQEIQKAHMVGNGWCDVGYHFLITVDGRIWEGRKLGQLGTHVADQNGGNIGIAFAGCFDDDPYCDGKAPGTPTPMMLRAAADLIRQLSEQYAIPIDDSNVLGHRDHGAATVCPGQHVHDRLAEIRNLAAGPPSPCGVVGPGGGVIDDSSDCFEQLGTPSAWRWRGSPLKSYHYTYTTDLETADNVGRWHFTVEESGPYQISAFVPPSAPAAEIANYVVVTAADAVEITIDQRQAVGWIDIGEHQLVAGDSSYVELADSRSAPLATMTEIVFDAVRLRAPGSPPEDPGDPPPPSEEEPPSDEPAEIDSTLGGCGVAARGAAPWFALVLALCLVRRQQWRC